MRERSSYPKPFKVQVVQNACNLAYAYLKDVLMRLPTQRAGEIWQLLPHQWMPAWLTQGEFAGRLPLG